MSENEGFLKNIPFFAGLKSEVLHKIENLGTVKHYYKNSVILFENQSDSVLFIVISGKVRLSKMSSEGSDVKLSFLEKSEFWGDTSIMDGMTPNINITAEEDSELFIINRKDFLQLLKNQPDVSISLINELTKKLYSAEIKIKTLSLKSAEGKVASVLLQILNDQGKAINGLLEIEKLPLQQKLAETAMISRETVSRSLHSFVKKGIIEMSASKIRVKDYEKLKEQYN